MATAPQPFFKLRRSDIFVRRFVRRSVWFRIGNRGRGRGGIRNAFAGDAEDVGGGAMVAGVEDAGEFVVGFEERVGFVDHECGPEFLDGAVECRRADVGRDEWAIDQS